ncbi:hypothetical protein [Legionella spiritensis]|uniref:hypothetical protein n=1 Tax=Legionella spiritensis TaxID=452 RepID=UPI000F712780|nr:hypothetical protein [Legionella spiritensis]VEG92060.1 Synaptobrevin [Legionella spiritensis]
MKCYALATQFNGESLQWHVPGNTYNPTTLFARKALGKWKKDIDDFVRQMQPGFCHCLYLDGYYIYGQKLGDKACVIVCDTELTIEQMRYLAYYLLNIGVDRETVAAHMEKYTRDEKVEQVKQELGEVKKIMIDNIDKVLERGERIEDLIKRTEGLADTSFLFHKKAKELNSCWPCTIF